MSLGSIIVLIFGCSFLYGGLAYCLFLTKGEKK